MRFQEPLLILPARVLFGGTERQYNTIQYNLFPPEVIPTVWLHTFVVSDD